MIPEGIKALKQTNKSTYIQLIDLSNTTMGVLTIFLQPEAALSYLVLNCLSISGLHKFLESVMGFLDDFLLTVFNA